MENIERGIFVGTMNKTTLRAINEEMQTCMDWIFSFSSSSSSSQHHFPCQNTVQASYHCLIMLAKKDVSSCYSAALQEAAKLYFSDETLKKQNQTPDELMS